MYFGMFRIGEMTESQHVVKAKDVHIGINKDKLMFVLHSSKMHGKGTKPQIVKINCFGANALHGSSCERALSSFALSKC